jgi:hypothetical protein
MRISTPRRRTERNRLRLRCRARWKKEKNSYESEKEASRRAGPLTNGAAAPTHPLPLPSTATPAAPSQPVARLLNGGQARSATLRSEIDAERIPKARGGGGKKKNRGWGGKRRRGRRDHGSDEAVRLDDVVERDEVRGGSGGGRVRLRDRAHQLRHRRAQEPRAPRPQRTYLPRPLFFPFFFRLVNTTAVLRSVLTVAIVDGLSGEIFFLSQSRRGFRN